MEREQVFSVVYITANGEKGKVLYSGTKANCYKYRQTLNFIFKYKVLRGGNSNG